MTKKELMIKAHKMTKEIKAEYPAIDYKFQLGLCLAYLHEEGEKEMSIEEKLQDLGYKVWSKKDSEGKIIAKRIYINNLAELAEKINFELMNAKGYRKDSMYFNCLDGKFYFSVTNGRKATVLELIAAI